MAKVLLEAGCVHVREGDPSLLKVYQANIAFDLWSFGIVLYHLVFGCPFWKTDRHDSIANKTELVQLAALTRETLAEGMLYVDPNARGDLKTAVDLLGKLLEPHILELAEGTQWQVTRPGGCVTGAPPAGCDAMTR